MKLCSDCVRVVNVSTCVSPCVGSCEILCCVCTLRSNAGAGRAGGEGPALSPEALLRGQRVSVLSKPSELLPPRLTPTSVCSRTMGSQSALWRCLPARALFSAHAANLCCSHHITGPRMGAKGLQKASPSQRLLELAAALAVGSGRDFNSNLAL